MEIILTEKDLGNAVKLYLAFSGVTRAVTSHEFARKLKGNDAGISVSIELDDSEMSPEELQALALTQKQARGLNDRVAEQSARRPGGMSQVASDIQEAAQLKEMLSSPEPTAAETPDEEIPFVEPAAAVSEERKAELAEPAEAAYDNPFAAAAAASKTDPEPEAVEATAVEGNAVPGGSPFAEAMAKDKTEPDYSAPANPFADSAPVVPAEAVAEAQAADAEPPAAPINLFG